MIIHYDIPKINHVLDDFYYATGARIDLVNNEFLPISYSGHEICGYCRGIQQDADSQNRCSAFDRALLQKSCDSRSTQQAVCPFGLTNIVTPVFWEENIIGYIFFGQMKTKSELFEPERLKAEYEALPIFTPPKIQGVSNLAQILIEHILTENMAKPDVSEVLQRAVTFICENLEKDLSVKRISRHINVSKSVLYSKFHARFHCTLGEYINKQRIEKSVELLRNTNLPMEEIAQACGFSSASYFTKTFKKLRGTTPLKFRKSQL